MENAEVEGRNEIMENSLKKAEKPKQKRKRENINKNYGYNEFACAADY